MQQLLINSEESEITILDRLLAAQIGVQKLLQTWSVKQVCSISNTLSQFWCNFQQLSDVKGGLLRGIVNCSCVAWIIVYVFLRLGQRFFFISTWTKPNFYKQCWPYMVSIKKKWKKLVPYRKNCNLDHFVSFINYVLIPYLLTVLLSIHLTN